MQIFRCRKDVPSELTMVLLGVQLPYRVTMVLVVAPAIQVGDEASMAGATPRRRIRRIRGAAHLLRDGSAGSRGVPGMPSWKAASNQDSRHGFMGIIWDYGGYAPVI